VARVALEIPKVGLVMENARLVRWLKHVGDVVKEGEPLLELETEKSVVEIESTQSGRLVEILLQVDQEARVGDRVAWLENDEAQGAAERSAAPAEPGARATAAAGPAPAGAARAPQVPVGSAPAITLTSAVATAAGAPSRPAAATTAAGVSAPARPAATSTQAAAPVAARPAAASTPAAAAASDNRRVRSSPVARRIAAEHALDLTRVTGTGPRGRVQLADVRRALEAQSARNAASSLASEPQPLSGMRRALARSMTLSNATVPQFNVERAVDWTAVHTQRATIQAELPPSTPCPSVNDFLLQAITRALLSFPALNATFSGDANSPDACIVPTNGAHIGLVVAVENGLLVPVLHRVEQFGLTGLALLRSETVERALQGKLKREELEGATISVSNLGARGPDRFTAMINPPQSAILAVGRQRDCAVVINGGVRVRPMSQLTLTVDHRVADGRLASDFLAYMVEILEGDTWRLN
jgi:pyruvate dehydrogenase E2 component (dihydrolipoyllysine-residue acetyltransferase)